MTEPPDFPDLFLETYRATVLSILIFAIADVRELTRKKQLEGSEQVLNLPLAGTDFCELFRNNMEALQRKLRSNEFKALSFIMERHDDAYWEASDLHFLGDDKASQECVYSISTNSRRKEVFLAFRGSITMEDWFKDAKMFFGEVPNPLEGDGQPETLAIHLGYKDYLYGKDVSSENNKSKIQTILEQVGYLLHEHPDYKLYATGHSLGAALAVLASFEAAAKFGRPDCPVTCIAIANPRVAGSRYRTAFQSLEKEHTLRCLVVHNDLDLVPLQPDRLFACDFFRKDFCQCGIQLRLAKKSYTINYVGSQDDTPPMRLARKWTHLFISLSCSVRMAANHNFREYLDRLLTQKEELSKLYLDDLYNDM